MFTPEDQEAVCANLSFRTVLKLADKRLATEIMHALRLRKPLTAAQKAEIQRTSLLTYAEFYKRSATRKR